MHTVLLKPITHKGERRIAAIFPFSRELNTIAASISGCKFSKSLKHFHYPNTKETLRKLAENFTAFAEVKMEGNFEKPEVKQAVIPQPGPTVVKDAEQVWTLGEEGKQKIQKFKNWMQSKRYSGSTINTYADALKAFLTFYRYKVVSEINNEDIITFNNDFVLKHGLSSSYQNQVVNAIKLFFRIVENTKIDIDIIHRPKRQKLLPNVLSKEEVKLILNAHNNIKHKAMLSLIYSCGLRSGELIALRPEHVDSKRGVLIIKQAKGRKDRIAPLSTKIVEMLREYYTANKPSVYLFEGQYKNQPYDSGSLQKVLKQALEKVGINKPVTLHWLRYSYATHLLEIGTDLRNIQEILGHSSSKTTEIYTHVSTKNIQKITSPFDYL